MSAVPLMALKSTVLAENSVCPCCTTVGRLDWMICWFGKMLRNSPRTISGGWFATPLRSTTACPISWTLLPSLLERPRSALAVVTMPSGLTARSRGAVMSKVSVSGR